MLERNTLGHECSQETRESLTNRDGDQVQQAASDQPGGGVES